MCALVVLAAVGCSTTVITPTPAATATLHPYQPAIPEATITAPREPLVPEETPQPTATPFTHTVEQNETLLIIAARYGISLEVLLAANPGINPRLLSIGQQLTIPGAEGGQLIPELPTTTPVPVLLSEAACYPTISGGLTCLAAVSNLSDEAVEGVIIQLTLFSASGETSASTQAYTPLNLLRPGGTLPVAATFLPPVPQPFTVRMKLLGAIPAADSETRYHEVTLRHAATEASFDGMLWTVSGDAQITQGEGAGVGRLVILAMGLDMNKQIVGFTEVEFGPEDISDAPIPFTAPIFSLGPKIADILLAAEAPAGGE